jgi:hypothetical protein
MAVFVCFVPQLLGLLLPKYVPDESLLRQPSWIGVLQNADALVPMLQQHVLEPLLHGKNTRLNDLATKLVCGSRRIVPFPLQRQCCTY